MAAVRARIVLAHRTPPGEPRAPRDWLVVLQFVNRSWDNIQVWWSWFGRRGAPKVGAVITVPQSVLDA